MSISESRFNMWRAVVAMIHADGVVQPHEINFIFENINRLSLSVVQRETLMNDLRVAGNIEQLFGQIISRRDKEDFFYLARAIAWSDGEFDEHEQELIARIRALPTNPADVAIMEHAVGNFRDLYIEGEARDEDPSVLSVIRGLLSAKAA